MKRVLLCAVLMACSGMASAVVYKWVDAQGKVQYGDRPPDGVRAEVVELLGVHTGRSAKTDAPAPATAKNSAVPAADLETKKAVQAQERYKKLIDGRHLYKPGDNGERQYLTSEEIDSERVTAKRDIDAICNSST